MTYTTVRDLIAALEKAPPDAIVLTSDNEDGHRTEIAVYRYEGAVAPGRYGDHLFTDDLSKEDALRLASATPQTFVIVSHFSEDGDRL